MDAGYGRIRITYYGNQEQNNAKWAMKSKCTKCGDEYDRIRAVKTTLNGAKSWIYAIIYDAHIPFKRLNEDAP